jgi:hypothetical protein
MKRLVISTLGASILGLGLVAAQGAAATPSAAAQAPAQPSAPAPKMAAAHAPAGAALAELTAAEQTAMVKQYCATCHNDRTKPGGLSFASFDATQVAEHADVTERMIRRLRSGLLPPAGARRPEGDGILTLASSLESRIDRAAAASGAPAGRPGSWSRARRTTTRHGWAAFPRRTCWTSRQSTASAAS